MQKILYPLVIILLFFFQSCRQKQATNREAATIEMKKWDIGDIRIRDPFILRDDLTSKYYMYAQKGNRIDREDWDTLPGVEAYSSQDLRIWSGPKDVFTFPVGFWADFQVWAPEVHSFKDKFYLFVTLSSRDTLEDISPVGMKLPRRGTQVLVSDSPEGPFKPFDNKPHTPQEWSALDGTLWVEDDIPYMVFCHEWTQIGNGSMELVQLADDLSAPVTEPVTLFHAGDADWVNEIRSGGMVTDGCFLYRTEDGKLIMIWSSFGEQEYAVATAISENGQIDGPWVQTELLFSENGGHGMIFKTFDGELCLIFHQPNRGPEERAVIYHLSEENNRLILGEKYFSD